MALRRSVAAALGLALVASPWSMHGARAEETDVEMEEAPTHFLTDMPLEADGVETTFLFPENRDLALTSGEPVELLCGFYNGGDVPLNVTMLGGSLNSPLNFNLYVQNWTSPTYNTVVQPDMQATFGITIKPASQLQPHEYTAAMSIFYESDTELFASTFFNSTVLIQEPGRFLDLQTFFMYVFIVAVVGGLAFSGFKGLQSAGVLKKKSSKARSAVGSRSVVGEDNEWLKGTAADSLTAPKKRSVRRK